METIVLSESLFKGSIRVLRGDMDDRHASQKCLTSKSSSSQFFMSGAELHHRSSLCQVLSCMTVSHVFLGVLRLGYVKIEKGIFGQ